MSHHVYTTEGFVIGGAPSGESNKFFYIFTKDLGLVGASAQSVRAYTSKLRFGLQDFSHSMISFVKGKNSWKITNAVPQKNFYSLFRDDTAKLVLSANVLALLKKLLAGEEKNQALYELLSRAFDFLEKETLSKDELSLLESLLMVRIMHNLGYIGDSEKLEEFFASNDWNKEILASTSPHKREMVSAINTALRESQL